MLCLAFNEEEEGILSLTFSFTDEYSSDSDSESDLQEQLQENANFARHSGLAGIHTLDVSADLYDRLPSLQEKKEAGRRIGQLIASYGTSLKSVEIKEQDMFPLVVLDAILAQASSLQRLVIQDICIYCCNEDVRSHSWTVLQSPNTSVQECILKESMGDEHWPSNNPLATMQRGYLRTPRRFLAVPQFLQQACPNIQKLAIIEHCGEYWNDFPFAQEQWNAALCLNHQSLCDLELDLGLDGGVNDLFGFNANAWKGTLQNCFAALRQSRLQKLTLHLPMADAYDGIFPFFIAQLASFIPESPRQLQDLHLRLLVGFIGPSDAEHLDLDASSSVAAAIGQHPRLKTFRISSDLPLDHRDRLASVLDKFNHFLSKSMFLSGNRTLTLVESTHEDDFSEPLPETLADLAIEAQVASNRHAEQLEAGDPGTSSPQWWVQALSKCHGSVHFLFPLLSAKSDPALWLSFLMNTVPSSTHYPVANDRPAAFWGIRAPPESWGYSRRKRRALVEAREYRATVLSEGSLNTFLNAFMSSSNKRKADDISQEEG